MNMVNDANITALRGIPLPTDYSDMLQEFLPFHSNANNVNNHIFTSAIGIVGLFSLLHKVLPAKVPKRALVCALTVLYSLGLVYEAVIVGGGLTVSTVLATWAVVWSCLVMANKLDMNVYLSALFLIAGYGLQDVAHFVAGEPTFQGATWGNVDAGMSVDYILRMFMMHVYYLVPLVLDAASANTRAVVCLMPFMVFVYGNRSIDSFNWFGIPHVVVKDRMMKGNLGKEEERKDLETIRAWAIAQNPARGKTTHWWVNDLGKEAKDAFARVENCDTIKEIFDTRFFNNGTTFSSGYSVDIVRGMNEVYISGPNRKGTSDEVFFTEHIDGPYGFFPFASLYRCILGLDMNTEVSTIFTNLNKKETVQTGDFVAFDFHREPHLISSNPLTPNKDFRIVLKLHYAVYPKSLAVFGHALHWLTVKYNEAFRALFLFTLTPTSGWSSFVGEYLVNGFTKIWNFIHTKVGLENIFYLCAISVVGYVSGCRTFFLLGSNYVHYFRYITTYYFREGANYGHFKRDALLYKVFTVICLAYFALKPILSGEMTIFQFTSLYMPKLVLIAFGYFVCVSATAALGVDGTYFGIELGHVKADYQFIKSFPYNVFPHPMILSQVFSLSVMFTLPHMHDGINVPIWYLPLHCFLYLTHCAQEIYDYHAGTPWYKLKNKDE